MHVTVDVHHILPQLRPSWVSLLPVEPTEKHLRITMASNGHNERVVLNPKIKPTHYDLELCPDLDAFTFTCNESIKLTISEANLASITLHSKEIHIEEASLKCGSAEALVVESISYNRKATTVTLTFGAAFPTGEAVLSIKYLGILNSDMAGFYRSSYSDADGKKKVMASTQFESLDARRAFVCVDEPAVKATFSVALVLPAYLTALSNMPEKSSTHLPARKGVTYKKVCFDVSPRMSTYLLAWAVGEFDHVAGVTKGGVALRVFSPPGRAAQGAFALDAGIRALDFYDDFFKVPSHPSATTHHPPLTTHHSPLTTHC
jgi:aminopeptidase N